MPLLMAQPFIRIPNTEPDQWVLSQRFLLRPLMLSSLSKHSSLPVTSTSLAAFQLIKHFPLLYLQSSNIRQKFIFPTHSLSLVIGLSFPYTLITLAAVLAHVLCSSAPQWLVLMGEREELYRLSLFQGHTNMVWPFMYLHKPFTSLLCNPKLTIPEAIGDILFLFSESQFWLPSLPNLWQGCVTSFQSYSPYTSCLHGICPTCFKALHHSLTSNDPSFSSLRLNRISFSVSENETPNSIYLALLASLSILDSLSSVELLWHVVLTWLVHHLHQQHLPKSLDSGF